MIDGIYLLLGTNLGDKKSNLKEARLAISKSLGDITGYSDIYETKAWGKENQPSFLNQVLEISSDKTPEVLLDNLLTIEKELGRVRKEKWGARLIDIDILYYSDWIHDTRHLKIPHPGIPKRRFTLVPLVELNHEFVHPVLKKSNNELLQECEDRLEVRKVSSV